MKGFALGLVVALVLAIGVYTAMQAFTITSVERTENVSLNIEGVNDAH